MLDICRRKKHFQKVCKTSDRSCYDGCQIDQSDNSLLLLREAFGQGGDERVQVPRPREVDAVQVHQLAVRAVDYLT